MSLTMIVTTFENEKQAQRTEKDLLERRMAACVKLSSVKSSYLWKGKVVRGEEVMMTVITDVKKSQLVVSLIKQLHPYDVPEIIEIPVKIREKAYMEWVENVTKN